MADAALSALFDSAQSPPIIMMSCRACGGSFASETRRKKLCASCTVELARERCRLRANKGVVGSKSECQGCGVEIVKAGSRTKFCPPCAHESRLDSKRQSDANSRRNSGVASIGDVVPCHNCNSPFAKMASYQKYCCQKCRTEARRKIIVPSRCALCASDFIPSCNRQFYCGRCSPANLREKKKQYREENSEKFCEYNAKYRSANIEKIRAGNSSRKKKKLQDDPSYAIEVRISSSMSRALRSLKAGFAWESLVGYQIQDLMRHIERQFLPGMSWGNRREWHIDHIVPISSFTFSGADDPNVKACWALSNLRPLWAKENMSKNNKRLFLI